MPGRSRRSAGKVQAPVGSSRPGEVLCCYPVSALLFDGDRAIAVNAIVDVPESAVEPGTLQNVYPRRGTEPAETKTRIAVVEIADYQLLAPGRELQS